MIGTKVSLVVLQALIILVIPHTHLGLHTASQVNVYKADNEYLLNLVSINIPAIFFFV